MVTPNGSLLNKVRNEKSNRCVSDIVGQPYNWLAKIKKNS